mgnify:CR=1 FL=1
MNRSMQEYLKAKNLQKDRNHEGYVCIAIRNYVLIDILFLNKGELSISGVLKLILSMSRLVFRHDFIFFMTYFLCHNLFFVTTFFFRHDFSFPSRLI